MAAHSDLCICSQLRIHPFSVLVIHLPVVQDLAWVGFGLSSEVFLLCVRIIVCSALINALSLVASQSPFQFVTHSAQQT